MVRVRLCWAEGVPGSDALAPPIPIKLQVNYSIRMPEIARAITSRWICSVPSKMS